MIVYAIRRKGTDQYLPLYREGWQRRKGSRGYSWDVPIEGGGKFGPRLFGTKRSADNALVAWLRGCWQQSTYRTGEYGSEVDVEVSPVEPEVPRKREDMEVVAFKLVEIREQKWKCRDGTCVRFRNADGGCNQCGAPCL